MYVVGAKNSKEIGKIREIVPDSYLLIPGVGIQGGNMAEICRYGLDKNLKLIINSSRSIIPEGRCSNFCCSSLHGRVFDGRDCFHVSLLHLCNWESDPKS